MRWVVVREGEGDTIPCSSPLKVSLCSVETMTYNYEKTLHKKIGNSKQEVLFLNIPQPITDLQM